MIRLLHIFGSVVVFALLAGSLKADVPKPPLNNAEGALAHFRQVSLPALEKRSNEKRKSEKDPNPVTSIRKWVITIRCGRLFPKDIRDQSGAYRHHWPKSDKLILGGSKEEVQKSRTQTWTIYYSTGDSTDLCAYIDAVTGKLLLAFLLPEG